MSLLFWKNKERLDTDTEHAPALPVDEQHALPVGIYWIADDSTEAQGVASGHPLPVSVIGSVNTNDSVVVIPPFIVPGIGAAVAYAAEEQMGTVFSLVVPPKGVIREVKFHDLDDEGVDKEIWLFSESPTLAADNAAFSIADADNLNVIAVFAMTTWRDGVNCQVGFTLNTPASYDLRGGNMIYGTVKTKGADNIAAGSEPRISLVIERYA